MNMLILPLMQYFGTNFTLEITYLISTDRLFPIKQVRPDLNAEMLNMISNRLFN